MPSTLTSWDHWKRRYNSPPDDLIAEFYVPAFARAVKYDRAVGFFSSSLLGQIAPSIDQFVINGGTMRLVTSPANLSDEDLMAMGKGEELRVRLEDDLITAIHSNIPGSVLKDRLELLTWMVANGKLQARIALREHSERYSLFHEKIGVFTDAHDYWMTFTGSPNETMGGAVRHSESFPLHRSWVSEDQLAYASEERERFEAIWDERIEGIATWTVNDWIAEPMRECFGTREPSLPSLPRKSGHRASVPPIEEESSQMSLTTEGVSLLPSIPHDLRLRNFQRDAVNGWLRAGGHGSFAMATGTGKTITALAAATQASAYAAQRSRPLLVLVVVPSIDLVGQWSDEAERFGFRPAKCHGGMSKRERDSLKSAFSAARVSSGRRAEMVVTTARSLTPLPHADQDSHFLQRQLSRHNGLLMIIGDEMHSLGTPAQLAALPKEPTFSLGLSATPKRHGDEVGTSALLNYFGDVVVSISIKDAIYKYDALVPYDYYIEPVDLTDEEATQFRVISQKIATAYAAGDEEAAERHIRARTRLTQHASNKLIAFRSLLASQLAVESYQIVYVAEGKDPATDLAQIDAVETMMRDDFDMRVERYYGEIDANRRDVLQDRLAAGDLQALIAMKCLDEGVDIPSARIGVILASTQNPRQFVQRRGRLLRKNPDSPKTHAKIFDFLVLPPRRADEQLSDSEKRLLGMELSRAFELADAARNTESRFQIIECAYEYDLNPEMYSWMTLSENDDMQEWSK